MSALAAARKISGRGLMTPTRCEITTAERCADQPAASRNRSTATAIGQFDTIATGYRAASVSSSGPISGGTGVRRTNADV